MKKVVAFTPCDEANAPYLQMMLASLRKFHSAEELPHIQTNKASVDPMYFYRATPIEGSMLLKEYDTVIKIDADSIITSDLSHLWEGAFDLGVVNNSNPREFKSYPYQFMGIPPANYYNCGLVVMKNPQLVDHWLRLCQSTLFDYCQMKEQDLMNILCLQDYGIRYLDSQDKFHGLSSKGYWPDIYLKDDKLILPKGDEYPSQDKEIAVIHWAGGNDPTKMKDFNIRFSPDVAERLKWLVSSKNQE